MLEATFEIVSGITDWGNIQGDISNQTDLKDILDTMDSQIQGNHQEISNKQDKSNLVTSLSSASTDLEYPSAKCVYDIVGNIENVLNTINSGSNL